MEKDREAAGGKRAPGPLHAQRLAGLLRANQVRGERAEVKAALRDGELEIADLIAKPPECLLSANLAEVLLAAPGFGQARVRRLLAATRLSPAKPIGSLTERQRQELAQALGP